MFRTDMEISINYQQKKLQKKIDKLNNLSDELQIKYNNILTSFNNINELQEQKLKERKLKQLTTQESIVKWFNDSIIEKKGTKVRRSILYANYVSYCKENDLLPRKRTEVFVYIHSVMDTLVKIKGYHYFKGYELKN